MIARFECQIPNILDSSTLTLKCTIEMHGEDKEWNLHKDFIGDKNPRSHPDDFSEIAIMPTPVYPIIAAWYLSYQTPYIRSNGHDNA